MNSNEFKIILSLEEIDKINEKIKNLEKQQIELKNKILFIENKKNLLQIFFGSIITYTENFILYLLEFIIDIPND